MNTLNGAEAEVVMALVSLEKSQLAAVISALINDFPERAAEISVLLT